MNSLFDQSALIQQRNRSAHSYADETELPAIVEKELAERLNVLTMVPETILVLGTVGHETVEDLCNRFGQAQITIADWSPNRLTLLEQRLSTNYAGRIDFLKLEGWEFGFADAAFDLIFSALFVPLCDDLVSLFGRLHGLLRPAGCLHFSSLGPDTFAELRMAWQQVDESDPYHALEPPDMHDVGDALVHAGFREPVMDRENYTLTYSSAVTLLADLRKHGVCNGFSARKKGLTGRALWRHFKSALESDADTAELSLTVEIVIGQAWRGETMSQQRRADGSVGITLDAFARQLRPGAGDKPG